jgi:hypothetical protein
MTQNVLHLLLFCSIICSIATSKSVSLNLISHIPLGQRENFDNGDQIVRHSTKFSRVLSIRGGEESVGLLGKIQLNVISVLKMIVPRSWWPKSWKPKNSKLMSKEHLEKSFAKGDSSSRIQKVTLNVLLFLTKANQYSNFHIKYPGTSVFYG